MTIVEIIGIILLIIGFVLVGVEMAVPGFGLPGISGIISLVAGVIMTAKTVEKGIVMTIVIIIILAIMLAVIMTILRSKAMKAPIVLNEDVKGEQGFLNSTDLEYLIGKEGMAISDLRPGGKGCFDEIDFDVISEGKYIEKGKRIKISKIKDNQLLVKEI